MMCMGQPQQIKIGWRYNHANLVRDAGCRWGSSGLLDYDGNDLQEVFKANSRRTSTEFEKFRGSCDPSVTQRCHDNLAEMHSAPKEVAKIISTHRSKTLG